MTFPTIVFGRVQVTGVGINYVDIDSISSGGFRLFIVPTRDVGNAGIDIGFTYINQFGTMKTTTVSTAIAALTTSGTHIQVVLEPGDTGIRDIISISYFTGGTIGDRLSFESWNEGLGRSPIEIIKSDVVEHIPEITIGLYKGKEYSLSTTIPVPWFANPLIPIPIEMSRSLITAWLSDIIVDRSTITKFINLVDDIGARKEIVDWIPETLSNRDIPGKPFFVFKSWLESVVGQVLSGYIQNVGGQVIKNAFSMILLSTTATEITHGGASVTADVNPDTGLYQAFLKKVVYDKRYIIVKIGIKNIALEGAGIPMVIDGNQQLPIPYNLQFACPVKNCDFAITRKVV